ncbi:MAG: hypothetical protein RLO81_15495 [Fulvivirga sp.]|uniref:hypothetical protein n=1 Tax=Fulvivirga sp. TaxID=1931237 RepID=UPI0032EB49F8
MKTSYTTDYFSTEFKIIIGISFLATSFIITHFGFSNLWYVLILILFGITATMKYQLSVDTQSKIITDATKILGQNVKKYEYRYKELRAIRLDKENEGYTANSRSRERQVNFTMYTASIITDKEDVEILTSSNYKSFSEKLKQFADELNLEIQRSF